jgi:hypothetical protein
MGAKQLAPGVSYSQNYSALRDKTLCGIYARNTHDYLYHVALKIGVPGLVFRMAKQL